MTITDRGLDQQRASVEPLRQLNLLSISDEHISLSHRQQLSHQERDPIAKLLRRALKNRHCSGAFGLRRTACYAGRLD